MLVHEQSPKALFVTYRDAAGVLALSESMVKKMARLGTIKVVKFGRAARIPVSELTRIVATEEKVQAVARPVEASFRGGLTELPTIRRDYVPSRESLGPDGGGR